jgi:hypothetical protein
MRIEREQGGSREGAGREQGGSNLLGEKGDDC